MNSPTSIDVREVAKFAQQAAQWWNPDGPLKTLHDINPARLAWIESLMTLSQANLLDVGCGGGILTESLAQKGAQVSGLDVDESTIQAARAHAVETQSNTTYICQPLEHFTAPLFDAITCMEMLEHVADPNLIIEHSARLLKPGGWLFLSTINRTIKAYLGVIVAAEYLLSLLPRQTHDYNKFIKPSELAALTAHYGFELVAIQGLQYNPLTRQAGLHQDVSMNYLLACRKK